MPDNYVYPENYFNIANPSSPWVSVQLRTGLENRVITDPSIWQEITGTKELPSNYFENMTIKDSGGIYNLELSLKDQNFGPLEDLILKCVNATRIASNPNFNNGNTPVFSATQGWTRYFASPSSSANLRIRFGYSDEPNVEGEDSKFFSVVDTDQFDERLSENNKNKTTLRSPWIYFQISNIVPNISNEGMVFQITAFSVGKNVMDTFKMVQQQAVIKDQPLKILIGNATVGRNGEVSGTIGGFLGNLIQATAGRADYSKSKIKFIFRETPLLVSGNTQEENEIEISLGSRPTTDSQGRYILQTKSLATLFTEFCNAVPQAYWNFDNNQLEPQKKPDPNGEIQDNSKKSLCSYSFTVNEVNSKDSNPDNDYIEVIFGYNKPNPRAFTRVYYYLNNARSLVKSFNVSFEAFWGVMNAPVFVKDANGASVSFVAAGENIYKHYFATDNERSAPSLASNASANVAAVVQKSIEPTDSNWDFSGVFANTSGSGNDGPGDSTSTAVSPSAAQQYVSQIANNMRQTMFKGSMTIPGDPFFLFTKQMNPYSYYVRVMVSRPGFYKPDGTYVSSSSSFVSGDYLIGSITHTISLSGFETSLEILKVPQVQR